MIVYNVQLSLNSLADKLTIVKMLEEYTQLCNYISNLIFEEKINLDKKIIHDHVYHRARKIFFNLPSQMVIKAENEIRASYLSAKNNNYKLDKPIKKKKQSIRLDKRLYSKFTNESIRLVNIESKNHRIPAKLRLYSKIISLFNEAEVRDPLLFYKNKTLFLAVPFNIKQKDTSSTRSIGIDLGIRRLVVSSDGLIISGKEFIKHKRKIRYLRRSLQSKNTKSSRRKLKTIKQKEYNFSNNYTHLVVNKLLKTDATTFVLEDLTKIKETTKKTNKGFNRTIHNNRLGQIPFYKLKQVLIYKALHLGKSVETVNPYNTSKNDYRGLKNGVRKGCRYYGSDGIIIDSDINASINILLKYDPHAISFCNPLDGSKPVIARLL